MIQNRFKRNLQKIREKYIERHADKESNVKKIDELIKENKELKIKIGSFFWNLCHQTEKVKGNVSSLVDISHKYGGETKDRIKSAVMNVLNEGIKTKNEEKNEEIDDVVENTTTRNQAIIENNSKNNKEIEE
jgi:hypothetical protein